jgi:hypothetical protein
MNVIVTPAEGGTVWQLTDLLGRSMGRITASAPRQFMIHPEGRFVAGQDMPAAMLRLAIRHAPKQDGCDIRFLPFHLQVDPPDRSPAARSAPGSVKSG